MYRIIRRSMKVLALWSLLMLCAAYGAQGQEIWSGRTFIFEKADFADWTLPDNQDRITESVWFTRKDNRGLFNIAQELGYGAGSPVDTEWATGNAVEWASLSFSTWLDWNGSVPPGMVGVDAVVHLISDDIYIDIRFESWTGSNSGGGFSYIRAVNPTSVEGENWGAIKALYR